MSKKQYLSKESRLEKRLAEGYSIVKDEAGQPTKVGTLFLIEKKEKIEEKAKVKVIKTKEGGKK